MNTTSNSNGKEYTTYSMKYQPDVYSEAKPYSVWQGYAVLIGLLGVLGAIVYVIVQYC